MATGKNITTEVGENVKIQGSYPLSDIVNGHMAQYALKGLWLLIGAVLAFILSQFFGLSTLVHELNGKLQNNDQTINLLLQQRMDTLTNIANYNQQLIKENERLRSQLNTK